MYDETLIKCSAIADRRRCRVRYSFGQKWKTIYSETISYGHYRSIFNHCDTIGFKIYRIRWKKTQNRGHYGVIEIGTNRKPVCDFLL